MNAPTLEYIQSRAIKTPRGCWDWPGHQNQSGYAVLSFGGLKHRKRVRVHRAVWELVNGPVPDGLCVLHRCDNRLCCNPAHLFLGTRPDNTADMCRKLRQAHGVRNGNHVLSPDQVLTIRTSKEQGKVLSARFGVSRSVISEIKTGKAWRHLTERVSV